MTDLQIVVDGNQVILCVDGRNCTLDANSLKSVGTVRQALSSLGLTGASEFVEQLLEDPEVQQAIGEST